MIRSVAVKVLILAVLAVVVVLVWPRATGTANEADRDTGGGAGGGEGSDAGGSGRSSSDDFDGTGPDGATEQEGGVGQTIPDSTEATGTGLGDGHVNGNGSYFSTLGAPPSVMRWVQSDSLIFNQPLPVDTPKTSGSDLMAAQIDEIIRGERLYTYGSGIEEDRNAPHIVLVDSDREQFTPVVFNPRDCGADTWWAWGSAEFEPYINGAYAEVGKFGVPVPVDFKMNADDGDFHLLIYDWKRDILIELWRAKPTNLTGRPGIEVCWGGVTRDFAEQATGIFPFPVGVTAAGVASPGLTITLDDLRRGEINHAIGVSTEFVIDNQTGEDYSYPANRNDGLCSSLNPAPTEYHQHVIDSVGGEANCLYEGQYLRLPSDFDVEAVSHPYARMIATAARDYGLVVQDVAGCFCFQAESGRTVTDNGLASDDPWQEFYRGTPEWEILWEIDWTRLEVLPRHWGRPDGYRIPCAVPPNRSAADNPMAGDPRCQVAADPYRSG